MILVAKIHSHGAYADGDAWIFGLKVNMNGFTWKRLYDQPVGMDSDA